MRRSAQDEATTGLGRAQPLVGRTRELTHVLGEFERVAGGGSCRRCTIVASPGVGKSRLIEEVTRSLGNARVLRAQCRPLGEAAVFEPLAATVEQAAKISSAQERESVIQALKELLAPDEDADVVIEQLSELLGIGEEPISLEGTFFGLKRVYQAVARRGPTLIVVEDVHWATPTLLDALEAFTSGLRDASILFLCSARPELIDTRPEWGATTRATSTITLVPLETAAVRELIAGRAGGALPDAVEGRIVAAAGGNPFFAEEIVDSLIDAGAIGRSANGPTFTGDVMGISLPRSVEGLIVEQLDALTTDERTVLEAASVVGEVFDVTSLQGMFTEGGRATLPSLMKLSRAGLIETHASDVLGEDRFRFRHALVRETTYRSASHEARAAHHHARALDLETRVGTDSDANIAIGYHLEQAALAHQNLNSDFAQEERLGRAAARRLGAGGLQALERSDVPSARNLLERAVALQPRSDPDALRLQLYLVEALIEVGDLSDAEALSSQVAEAARVLGDRGLEARATLASLLVSSFEGRVPPTEAARFAKKSISLFTNLGDHLGLTRAYLAIAEAHWDAMRHADTEQTLEAALAAARRAGSWRDEAYVLSWLSGATFWGPTPVEVGLRKAHEILDLSKGNRRVRATVMNNVACLEAMRKHFDTARELARRARSDFRELGLALRAAGSTHQSGNIEMLAGDYAAAEREFREGLETLQEMGEEGLVKSSRVFLAHALYECGRYGEAEEVLAPFVADNDPTEIGDWGATKAKLLARRGEFDAAERLGREAIRGADATDASKMRGDARFGLGEVLIMANRNDEAAQLISSALDLYRAKGDLASADRAIAALAALA